MAEVIQTSQTACIEPVNGAILNSREKARLSDAHDQTSKGTVTWIHIKASSQVWTTIQMPQYLWVVCLSFSFTGHKQTKDKTEQQNLHLADSQDPYSLEAEGVPAVGEGAKLLPLLWSASVGVTHHEPMVAPHMTTVEGNFSIRVGRDKRFCHSVILIMIFVLREAYVDVRIWRFKWEVAVHPILEGDNYLLSCLSWDPKWDEMSKVHIPHSCLTFLFWK